MEIPQEYGTAAMIGIASYVVYFNRGEHHQYAARYLIIFAGLVSAGVAFSVLVREKPFNQAVADVFGLAASYLAGLYASLVLYRILLHPLRRFPGPFGARMSAFWLSTQLGNSDAYRQVQRLHEQYGPYVRVGPADLSISHPKAVNAVYGPGSRCTKAAWYDLTAPMVSLQTLRVKALHDQRRRTWSTAFGDKALRGYEQRIWVHRQRLMDKIAAQNGQPINVSQWFNWYSFDVMGDLAFGRSFGMVDKSEDHWAIRLLSDGIHPLAYMLPVWFFRLLTAIPGLTRDWWRFIDFCAERLEERMRVRVLFLFFFPFLFLLPTNKSQTRLKSVSQMSVRRFLPR
jgi:tryprostatin B 6-hydroxylase